MHTPNYVKFLICIYFNNKRDNVLPSPIHINNKISVKNIFSILKFCSSNIAPQITLLFKMVIEIEKLIHHVVYVFMGLGVSVFLENK